MFLSLSGSRQKARGTDGSAAIIRVAFTVLTASLFILRAAAAADGVMPTEETLRLGERMYRDGILPSGEPMQAFIKGDLPVEGTAFSCVSCHLRGGLGSYEGRVYTLPVNAAKLFNPLYPRVKGYELTPSPQTYGQRISNIPAQRLAYTDKSLADALRTGVDPAGRTLDDAMPRYMLSDGDVAIMITYLKSLSPRFSPGVTDSTIRFAAIIAGDVNQQDRDALVRPLEHYVKNKNAMAALYSKKRKYARMAEAMLEDKDVAYRRMTLSVWVVTGPPDTWRRQLDEYYRTDPVFAFLGGISDGTWEPVHRFCEDNHIPCLMPVTKFPVVSDSGWYTLYFSKGLYQEGEAAARYLHRKREDEKEARILQVVRNSREGQYLADGFERTWKELGHEPPVTVWLEKGIPFDQGALQSLIGKKKPNVLLVWDGPEIIPALNALSDGSAGVETAFVAHGYLGDAVGTLPERARNVLYMTYPYRLPKDETRYNHHAEGLIRRLNLNGSSSNIAAHAFDITTILTDALMDMQGNYYRDTFFDAIGMLEDQVLPLYERLSFGPGQRYASKGCYIVQLGKGQKPELIQKSDWVVH